MSLDFKNFYFDYYSDRFGLDLRVRFVWFYYKVCACMKYVPILFLQNKGIKIMTSSLPLLTKIADVKI